MTDFSRSYWLLALILLGTTHPAAAQATTAGSYYDVIITHNRIWALTDSSRVRIFDTEGQRQTALEPDFTVKALHQNRQGDVVLIDDHRAVTLAAGRSGQRREQRLPHRLPPNTYGVVDNSRGQFFAVCDAGIVALTTGRTYRPSSSHNSWYRPHTNWGEPSTYFIDSTDRIWVGFGYGEWGGNLFVFDTRANRFLPLDFSDCHCGLAEVGAIFEGNAAVYVTTGMNHMMPSGNVLAFSDRKARLVLRSASHRDSLASKNGFSGEYIGAGAYDPRTNSLYFTSQHGIFRGPANADLQQLSAWQRLHVVGNPRTTIGFPSRIAKLTFTDDGHLVFLARYFGIGVFDGQSVKLID